MDGNLDKINKDFNKNKVKKDRHKIKYLLRSFELDDEELFEHEEVKKNSSQREK